MKLLIAAIFSALSLGSVSAESACARVMEDMVDDFVKVK